MIFITTGSRSFQFNRLLEVIDKAIKNGDITEEVFAQVGASDYLIKNYKYKEYLNHDEFNECLSKCDIVLTHGGTGVIVNSVKLGKKVVAVPRLAKYGEAIDDHQIQLVKAFSKMGMVIPCYECSTNQIIRAIETAKKTKFKPYHSNTQTIIDSIDDFIRG